jgi:hypothetical protein
MYNTGELSDPLVQSTQFAQMRIDTRFALGSVSRDEMQTYTSLLHGDDTGSFLVMPNHHTDDVGNIHGFRYGSNPLSDVAVLPLTQQMFHGYSCVECHDASTGIHPHAIRLLSDVQACRETLCGVLQEIRERQVSLETATFDCIPINVDATYEPHVRNPGAAGERSHDREGHYGVHSLQHQSEGRDCKAWAYDVPSFVGIYHAYVRGKDADVREHKLFIVCGGGCRKACDQYSNMVKDIAGNATVEELLVSDESWWLRRACRRNRCGILAKTAKAFDLKIPCTSDSNNYDSSVLMASPVTETLYHDIQRLQNGKIAVYNNCCDTTDIQNGIIHNMHPAEGVWIFQGATRTTSTLRTSFGGMFGHQKICGCFPVNTFQVPSDHNTKEFIAKERNVVSIKSSPNVIWYDIKGRIVENPDLSNADFVRCDESYLKHLETMQWNRDNQSIEFIPIVVAAMVPSSSKIS